MNQEDREISKYQNCFTEVARFSAQRAADDQSALSVLQHKQAWDGTVCRVISHNGSAALLDKFSSSISMMECEQSISRLQRELEVAGQRSAQRPAMKIDAAGNGRDVDNSFSRVSSAITVPPLRFPTCVSLQAEKAQHPYDQKKWSNEMFAGSNIATPTELNSKESLDHSGIISILTKLSTAINFRDLAKVVHSELLSTSECESVQVHFINPVLNLSKLDSNAFQRKFDLWSTNYPGPTVPNVHSQQAARQCITIRINEDPVTGPALYIPFTIPATCAPTTWKILGVVDLFRGSEKHWTQADESRVKVIVDLCSPMLMQRYKAIRMDYERRQAVLMRDAVQALHSQDRPEALCQQAAVFACRLTNAQAARVLLVSDNGKIAFVFEPDDAGKEKIQTTSSSEARVVEGELTAVYSTVIKTAKGISVADTRRDARFASAAAGIPKGGNRPISCNGISAATRTVQEPIRCHDALRPMPATTLSARPNTAPDRTVPEHRRPKEQCARPDSGLKTASNCMLPQPPASGAAASGDGAALRSARYSGASAQIANGRLPRQTGLVFQDEREAGGDTAEANEEGLYDEISTSRTSLPEVIGAADAKSSDVPPNIFLVPVMDNICPEDADRGEAGRAGIVRGVLEVVNKRNGPFDESDHAELAALCGTLYRCLVQVGKMEVLHDSLACDCKLLASSTIQIIVSSALEKLRVSTRSELAALYVPVEGRRVLQSEGVDPQHEVLIEFGQLPFSAHTS